MSRPFRLQTAAICGFSATTLVLIALPATLPAQSMIMEEIVVTAQRREQLLQDVPVAVTAYNAQQLERLQVTETLDIARLVPNFIGQNNTGLGTANVYSIRGLNNTESIATFDPPVGTYIDDIYVARQNANNFQLFDTERVEVLRGPQGTLFGRNTTGGAVRVILKKPSEVRGGFVEGGFGEYDRYQVRGTIDLPVNDQVLTKFSAYWIDSDGYVDNKTTGETLNGQESWGVRGAVRFLISDALTWDLAMDYIEDDQSNQINVKENSSRVTTSGLRQSGAPLAGFATGRKQFFGQGNEVDSFSIYSNLDWDIAGVGTLSFITGWRDMTQKFALDFLPNPLPQGGFTITNDGSHEQFSQEVKLAGDFGDRVSYVAGVFYLNEDNRTDFADILFANAFGPAVDRIMSNETDTWAIYGQADFSLTDQLTLTAGLRYTDEEKKIAFSDNRPGGALTSANMVANGIPLKLSETVTTPRIALQYEANDDLNFYVSATRGFKSGGWNARGTAPQLLTPFGPEKVWSYEGGMRWDPSESLRLNVTAFYSDVTDFQLPSAFEDPVTSAIVFITNNFADLRIKGIEFEMLATPVDNLTLLAALGLQNGTYRNLDQSVLDAQAACLGGDTAFCGRGIVSLNGDIAPPTRLPDYTLTIGGDYVWAVTPEYNLIPSAYLYAIGNHNITTNGVTETGVNGILDGYGTLTASMTLENTMQDWRVTLECKNCNDRTMPVSILANQTYLQDPRTWMLRFRKDFQF
jgi:iron complex outermembrane receptor protein